jgi:hypothetical protein
MPFTLCRGAEMEQEVITFPASKQCSFCTDASEVLISSPYVPVMICELCAKKCVEMFEKMKVKP